MKQLVLDSVHPRSAGGDWISNQKEEGAWLLEGVAGKEEVTFFRGVDIFT